MVLIGSWHDNMDLHSFSKPSPRWGKGGWNDNRWIRKTFFPNLFFVLFGGSAELFGTGSFCLFRGTIRFDNKSGGSLIFDAWLQWGFILDSGRGCIKKGIAYCWKYVEDEGNNLFW